MEVTERNLEYEDRIRQIVESHPKGTWPRIILARSNRYLLDYIDKRTPLLQDPKYTLATKIYWVLNDIHTFPLCQNKKCKRPLINQNANAIKGYIRPFCNLSCSCGSEKSILKAKRTCLERYGDPNYRNRIKAKQTYIKHYGVDNNMKSEKGKAEYNAAIQEKYGSNWITQTKHFQDKAKETWIKSYGVDNPTKSKEVITGIEDRNTAKWGVKNPMQVEEFQDNLKKTILDKYGVEYTFQAEEVKEKSKQTCLERYGVENTLVKNSITRQKRDETCLKKYGTKYPIQTYEVKEALKKSLKAWHANNTRPFKTSYKYDGSRFDSSWELYYYVWLKDNGLQFEYQPKISLKYLFKGEERHYHPDFLVEGKLVEIKGDQFFKEDGTMCCPWHYSSMTDEENAEIDALYEAKHQCMIQNNVKILCGENLEEAFKYIEETYGFDFFEQFKVIKNKKQKQKISSTSCEVLEI